AASSGAFVAFLDQDDVWAPDKLARQLAVFERMPGVGLVYSDLLIVTDEGAFVERHSDRLALQRGRLFAELIADAHVPLSTILVPRTVLDEAGGFRPAFRFIEDLDLVLRVAIRYPIEYVDAALATYRVHAA